MSQDTYAAVRSHGPLREVGPGLWQVVGTIRMGVGMTITRNMTVLREGSALTICNSVRLDEKTEAELRRLGEVRHVIKLGNSHGMDDPYYVGRFGAKLWAQPGSTHERGLTTDHELQEGGALPLQERAPQLFVFRNAKSPEAALFLGEPGVLLTCDSVQNWSVDWAGCSWLARKTMPLMGFRPGPLVGPFWLKSRTVPGKSLRDDFERLIELPIQQVLVAHGEPIRENGRDAIRTAMHACFGP